MKITFVMDGGDNLSGGHRAIAMFARGLRQLGHDVVLVARPWRPLTVRDRVRSLVRGRPWFREPVCKQSHFGAGGVPLHLLDEWRPVGDSDLPDADIVLATWWETAEWVFPLARSKGAKAHLVQDYEAWGGARERVDATYALPMAKIAMGDWVAGVIEKQFLQKPISVIQYGVDQCVFDCPTRGKQPIAAVGLTYSTAPRKGSDISIEAYRQARESIPDLRLVACGNGRVSDSLHLPAGTAYTAYASDLELKALYAQCDAWLFGSREEGFGLPILEAMACRTPVIGTPAGAAPMLLTDGAGILVQPENPGDMARAIVRLCRLGDAEWRALSGAAYSKATGFTWESAVQAFEAALRKAMEGAL